jgi:hypothetical protein
MEYARCIRVLLGSEGAAPLKYTTLGCVHYTNYSNPNLLGPGEGIALTS